MPRKRKVDDESSYTREEPKTPPPPDAETIKEWRRKEEEAKEEKKRSKYSYRCSNCGKGTQTNIPNCWIKHMKIADNDSMCRYCFSSKYGFYNGGNPKISKDEFNSSEKKPFYIVNSTEAKTYLRPIWKQLDRLGEEHILYTGSHTGMYFLVQYGEELKFCCDT